MIKRVAFATIVCGIFLFQHNALASGNPVAELPGLTHNWTLNSTTSDPVGGNDMIAAFGSPSFVSDPNVYPVARSYGQSDNTADEAGGTLDYFNSLSFWVKIDGAPTSTIRGIFDESGVHTIYADDTGALIFGNMRSGQMPPVENPGIFNNLWHNVIFTRDTTSNQARVYIDGVLKATSTGDFAVLQFRNGGKFFGGQYNSHPNSPAIRLQDFAFFSTTLSTTTIAYISGGASSNVSLTNPANNSTTTDFGLGFWQGTATLNATSSLDDGLRAGLEIRYCLLPNCYADLIETYPLAFYEAGTINWSETKSYSLYEGDWQARAILRAAPTLTSTILATSATTTFSVVSPVPLVFTFCNTTSTGIVADIQNALCSLFVPSQTQQADVADRFNSLKDVVATKPPFGYFVIVRDALLNMTSTATSSVFMASMEQLSDIFTPIRAMLATIIVFAFVMWLFHRIRVISF